MKLSRGRQLAVQGRGRYTIETPQKLADQKAKQATRLGDANRDVATLAGSVATATVAAMNNNLIDLGEAEGRVAEDDARAALAESDFHLDGQATLFDNTEFFEQGNAPVGSNAGTIRGYEGKKIPSYLVRMNVLEHTLREEKEFNKRNLSDRAYAVYEQAFDLSANERRTRTQQAILTDDTKHRRGRLEFLIQQAFDEGGQDSLANAQEILSTSKVHTVNEVAGMARGLSLKADERKISIAVSSRDPNLMRVVQENFKDENYTGFMSPAARLNQRAFLTTKIRSAEKQRKADRLEATALQLSNLQIGIGRGDYPNPYRAIGELYNAGGMTESKRTQLYALADSRQRGVDMMVDDSAEFAGFMAGEGQPDLYNKGHVKAARAYFARQTGKGEAPFDVATDMVKTTGIAPPQISGFFNHAVTSNDPKKLRQAGVAYRQIVDIKPHAMDKLTDKVRLALVQSAQLVDLPAGEARDMVAKRYAMLPSEEVARVAQYRAESSADASEDALNAFMAADPRYSDSDWFGNPYSADVPASTNLAFSTEFRTIEKAFYMDGGSVDESRQAAWDKISSYWGVSEINGSPQIMRRSPELIHNVQGVEGAKLMRRDLNRQTQDITDRRGVLPKNIRALTDQQTETDGSYPLAIYQDGLPMRPLYANDGTQARWTPQVKKTMDMELKAKKASIRSDIEAEKKKQASMVSTSRGKRQKSAVAVEAPRF